MVDGRRGKSSGSRRKSSSGRRSPPPDATGHEARYLMKVKEAGSTVVVHLVDGETVEGRVEYYDRHMIKIERGGAPGLFVRKSQIRYLHRREGE